MDFAVEPNGKFFVWTKKGRAPRYAHETHAEAFAEAKRLALSNPGRKFIVQQFLEKVSVEGIAEKEPAMNTKTIWYGAKDNAVRFAENQQALAQQGIDNPQQFTVNGEVTGLNLIGSSDQVQTQTGQSDQVHA